MICNPFNLRELGQDNIDTKCAYKNDESCGYQGDFIFGHFVFFFIHNFHDFSPLGVLVFWRFIFLIFYLFYPLDIE